MGVSLFIVSLVPVVGFLKDTGEMKNFRYFYLATGALALLVGSLGWKAAVPLIALLIPTHLEVRKDFNKAMEFTRKVHTRMLESKPREPGVPVFVKSELPYTGVAVNFLLGLDRVLLPPFTREPVDVYRWRPFMWPESHPIEITVDEIGYPIKYFLFVDPKGNVRKRSITCGLPVFKVQLGLKRARVDKKLLEAFAYNQSFDIPIRIDPWKRGPYRAVWIMPQGYIAVEVNSRTHGFLSLKRLLNSPPARGHSSLNAYSYVGLGLNISRVKSVFLLVTRLDPHTKKPVARAERMLKIEFSGPAIRFLLGMP